MKRSIVPFGPQHPVLPEPIHLDLVLEDEKVIEAIPSFGFVHRGMEDLASKRDFNDYLYVVERICGICSYMHGMAYCEGAERIFDNRNIVANWYFLKLMTLPQRRRLFMFHRTSSKSPGPHCRSFPGGTDSRRCCPFPRPR